MTTSHLNTFLFATVTKSEIRGEDDLSRVADGGLSLSPVRCQGRPLSKRRQATTWSSARFCSQPPPVFAAGGGMSLVQRKRPEQENRPSLNKQPTRSNRECVRTIDNKQQRCCEVVRDAILTLSLSVRPTRLSIFYTHTDKQRVCLCVCVVSLLLYPAGPLQY